MVELRELEQTVRTLPSAAQEELRCFIGYLQYKYQVDQPGNVARLGGLWADVNLDVSDADVRALRQRMTDQLMDKV